jgi:hypothetical protein
MAEKTAQVEEPPVEDEQPEPVSTDSLFTDIEEEEEVTSPDVPGEDQKSTSSNEDAEARLLDTQKWGNEQSEALAQARATIEDMQGKLTEQEAVEDTKKLDNFKDQIAAVFDDENYFENPSDAHKKALDLILEAVNSKIQLVGKCGLPRRRLSFRTIKTTRKSCRRNSFRTCKITMDSRVTLSHTVRPPKFFIVLLRSGMD